MPPRRLPWCRGAQVNRQADSLCGVDPLAPLAELPGVAEAVSEARAAVDAVLWPRNLGSDGPALARASRVLGAQACAALDGVDFPAAAWWSGDALEESAMGRTAAGVWRGYRELPALVDTWRSAPLQVIARLHALVAADLEDADDLGRPRTGDPHDPMRIGEAPSGSEAASRLSLMARLVGQGTQAPALVEAAVVHGELLALRPFTSGSGIIARQCTRVVMAARGLDPDLITIPEMGLEQLGRPAYVDAVRRYMSGTGEGVAAWIRFVCTSVSYGAAAADLTLVDIREKGLGKAVEEE